MKQKISDNNINYSKVILPLLFFCRFILLLEMFIKNIQKSILQFCKQELFRLFEKKYLAEICLLFITICKKQIQTKNIKTLDLVQALALTQILQQINNFINMIFSSKGQSIRLIKLLMEIHFNVKKNINRCSICWRNTCGYS